MTEQAKYPVDEWRRLHEGGMSYTAIGRQYGVSHATTFRWCTGVYGTSESALARSIAARNRLDKDPACLSCGIILSKSKDWRYPGAVKGKVCNLCRDHYPERAKEIDDEG